MRRGVLALTVNVKEQDVVSKLKKQVPGAVITLGIRWPEVCGEKTQHVTECHLIKDYLVKLLFLCHIGKVLMCPRVARELMSGRMHPLK